MTIPACENRRLGMMAVHEGWRGEYRLLRNAACVPFRQGTESVQMLAPTLLFSCSVDDRLMSPALGL